MPKEIQNPEPKMVSKVVRPIPKKWRVNFWAVGKVVGIILLLGFSFHYHFPAVETLKEWVHEEYYYTHNSVNWSYPENRSEISIQMWQHMTPKQQFVFYLVLVPYFAFLLMWVVLISRFRYKKIYINGRCEGRAIWYYGIYKNGKPYPGGHFYDVFSIARGFRHFSWNDYPLLTAGDFYKGKKIIYYSSFLFSNPARCLKTAIRDETQISFSLFSVFISGRYCYDVKHPTNDRMNYLEYNNISPDRWVPSDMKKYIEYTDEHIARNQKNVTQMILGNPGIIQDVVQNSMMIIPPDVKGEFDALEGADVS